MKPYGNITKRRFWGDSWYGKAKNIPSAKLRNKTLKLMNRNDSIETLLPTIKSRSTLKRLWRKQYCQNLFENP